MLDRDQITPLRHASLHASVSVEGEGSDASGGKLQGGHDAREMARLRWERERERKALDESEPSGERKGWRHVPDQTGEILQALATKAKKGDGNAARSYMQLLDRYPEQSTDIDLATLTHQRRQALLRHLDQLIEEEEAANGPIP